MSAIHVGYTFFYWNKDGYRDSMSVIIKDYTNAEIKFLEIIDYKPKGYYSYNLYLCEHGNYWTLIGDYTGCSCEMISCNGV